MDQHEEQKTARQSEAVRRVWQALESVKDPEIPVISLVELGMIPDVSVTSDRVTVRMLPTFAGCPALEVMRNDIHRALEAAGFPDPRVEVVFDPPWTTDRVTPEGLKKLKEFGLAPPRRHRGAGATDASLEQVTCPHCNSKNTTLESMFGPTLCRSIHYCNDCRQSFEQFKPV
ncbi:MAG: 1,2-phenylacetyl-CoA epoxidase subunit PaaD [Phycisphaerae bacterium]